MGEQREELMNRKVGRFLPLSMQGPGSLYTSPGCAAAASSQLLMSCHSIVSLIHSSSEVVES